MITATENSIQQRLDEIAALLREREQETKKIQTLDRRIAELAGIVPEHQTRKTMKKTVSRRQFAAGCGI